MASHVPYNNNFGSGAKIIFPKFDTIILSFMCHFSGNEIDYLS